MDDTEGPAYGLELEGFPYPWPLQHHEFVSQGIPLRMAFMDVKPANPTAKPLSFYTAKIIRPQLGKPV
jgi:hypothetical protein